MRKKSRKIAALGLSVCLIAGLLGGCGSGSKEQTTTEQAAESSEAESVQETKEAAESAPVQEEGNGEAVSFRYEWWGGNATHEAYTNLHATYTEANPGVTIEPEYSSFDGYQEKLMTQLAGGTVADLFHIDAPWMPELATRGDYFVDLKQQDILNVGDLDEGVLEQFCTFDGKLLAVPMGLQCLCMIVNRDAAEKYGIEIDGQMTWDEIFAASEKLHAQNPDAYFIMGDHGHLLVTVYAMLKQMTGTQVFNDDYTIAFTKEQLLQVYEWVQKAYECGTYEPLGDADLYYGSATPNPKWVNGECIAVLCWNSEFAGYSTLIAEDCGLGSADIVPYPVIEGAKQGSADIRPTYLVGISKDTQNLDAALSYLEWQLNSAEAAEILGSVRAVPSTPTQQQAAVEAGVLDEAVTKALNDAYANMAEKENEVTKNSEAMAAFTDEVSKVAYGMATPEEAVESTFEVLTEVLERVKAE